MTPKTPITLPTQHGDLAFSHFAYDGQEGLVVQKDPIGPAPFVRVHSSCVFSETFGTIDCDCSAQLNAALEYIGINGGIVIYLYQEGRGLGLQQKIEAIALQSSKALDTASAFSALGHDPDPRDYDSVVQVLGELGVSTIKLATNNPRKIDALQKGGIKVSDRVRLDIKTNSLMRDYIQEKVEVLGHYEDD